MLGVGLTAFAVGVEVLQSGRGTTAYTTLIGFTALPAVLVGPLAGTLAERWPPRRAMAVGLLLPGLISLGLSVLLRIESPSSLWVLALLGLAAAINTAHWPAYVKQSSMLLPAHMGRTSGLMQLGIVAQRVAAPGVAALLLTVMSTEQVLQLDGVLAMVGVASLWALAGQRAAPGTRRSVVGELSAGVLWIRERGGLVAFLVVLGGSYASGAVLVALGLPLLVAQFGSTGAGLVFSAGGLGMVAGTLVAAGWAPARSVWPALAADGLSALFLVLLGLVGGLVPVSVATVGFLFFYGLHSGLAQAAWQSRVPPQLQTRVFSVRAVALFGALPLMYLSAGPAAALADGVWVLHATLQAELGWAVEPGIRTVLVAGGLGKVCCLTVGLCLPSLRNLEQAVPVLVRGR